MDVGFAHVGGYVFHLGWGEFANVGCSLQCIVFLMRWYVSRCFFHFLDSLRGRNPPCCAVLFVKFCIGVALHVFSMVSEIFSTMLSNVVQASCHWSGVR